MHGEDDEIQEKASIEVVEQVLDSFASLRILSDPRDLLWPFKRRGNRDEHATKSARNPEGC